ncbi:hypothetical protein, partial [Pseudomonas sp. FG-3G]
EIHTPARTPQRRRYRRHRMLSNVQHPLDERRQLPQLQERRPAHLSRRRVRHVPGQDHRTEHRFLEHHHRHRQPPCHQRHAQADPDPQNQNHPAFQLETEL